MILLIDNYDSFTYNLVHQFGSEDDLVVVRNDAPELFQLAEEADGIVLSPGPGKPADAGLMEEVIRRFYRDKPILGICLGHQAIGEVFGGKVVLAPTIMHGKQSTIFFKAKGCFKEIQTPLQVMRYHSLMIEKESFPEALEIVAECDGCIMAVQHKKYPVYGLQFHPESIGTEKGQQLIDQFIKEVGNKHATII